MGKEVATIIDDSGGDGEVTLGDVQASLSRVLNELANTNGSHRRLERDVESIRSVTVSNSESIKDINASISAIAEHMGAVSRVDSEQSREIRTMKDGLDVIKSSATRAAVVKSSAKAVIQAVTFAVFWLIWKVISDGGN